MEKFENPGLLNQFTTIIRTKTTKRSFTSFDKAFLSTRYNSKNILTFPLLKLHCYITKQLKPFFEELLFLYLQKSTEQTTKSG